MKNFFEISNPLNATPSELKNKKQQQKPHYVKQIHMNFMPNLTGNEIKII